MKDKITKQEMIRAFKMLGELADREHLFVELFVLGGAAIMFAYPEAEEKRGGTTHDIDVVFVEPSDRHLSQVRQIIGRVQQDLGLAAGWMNRLGR